MLRAGNGKVADAVSMMTESINDFFPHKGRVLKLEEDRALINLGTLDGLAVDDRFLIARKGKARYTAYRPWYEVSDEDKLGFFVVSDVDEAVSVGLIENPGFFDLVNPGDDIYIIPENVEVSLQSDFGYDQSLKRELLKLY